MGTTNRRFAAPISDSKELYTHSSAVPSKTKACTKWGNKVWNNWSDTRTAASVDIGAKTLYALVCCFKRY